MTRRDISLCDHIEDKGRNLGGSILDNLIVSIVLDKGEVLELPQGSPASQERIPQPCCHWAAVLTRHSPVVTGQQPLASMASRVEMDLSSSWTLINPSLKSVGSKRTIYKEILIPTLLFKRKISGCFNKVLIIKPGPKERSWLIPIDPISSVQSLRCARLFVTPWTAVFQASLSISNSWSLIKLTSIKLVMPSHR